jgi:hypothetical protein
LPLASTPRSMCGRECRTVSSVELASWTHRFRLWARSVPFFRCSSLVFAPGPDRMGGGGGAETQRKVYEDKDRQEEAIRASALDWTIVRPTVLNDKPARGRIRGADSLRALQPDPARLRRVNRLALKAAEQGSVQESSDRNAGINQPRQCTIAHRRRAKPDSHKVHYAKIHAVCAPNKQAPAWSLQFKVGLCLQLTRTLSNRVWRESQQCCV